MLNAVVNYERYLNLKNLLRFKKSAVVLGMVALIASLGSQAEEQYRVVTKQNEQSFSHILRVHEKPVTVTGNQQLVFEYSDEAEESASPSPQKLSVSKEMFERIETTYMAQGRNLDTYISEKPVYHFKDLHALLVHQVHSDKACEKETKHISLPGNATFYGDVLLLSQPEQATLVEHQCEGKVHTFNVTFKNGTTSFVTLNHRGSLQKVESQYQDKKQSVISSSL